MACRTFRSHVTQPKKVACPWRFYFTFSKIRQRVYVDCEIVAEWIPNESRTFKIAGVLATDIYEVVDLLSHICEIYGHPLDKSDKCYVANIIHESKEAMKYN